MIFIILVYDYEYSLSQNCSLKYQFRALENVSCGMSGPTVDVGGWNESPDDNNDPMWQAMWPQLPPGVRNPENWEDQLETVCNPHGVPVIDLRAIATALE